MTGGTSPIGYLKAWHTNLYLSADAEKVREALAEGENILLHTCMNPTEPHSPKTGKIEQYCLLLSWICYTDGSKVMC